MRCFSRDLRAHEHSGNTLIRNPLLSLGDEFSTDATVSMRLRNNKTADLSISFALKVVNDADIDPADHRVRNAGDVNNVIF